MICPPPVHVVLRGVCAVHTDPVCGLPAQLYPSGWRCTPPRTQVHHPLIPAPPQEPEETNR